MPIGLPEVVQLIIELVKAKDVTDQEKVRLEQEVVRLREMLKGGMGEQD
jgi:hypothetical protein